MSTAPPLLLELRLNAERARRLSGFNVLTLAVQSEADIDRWAAIGSQRGIENSGKLTAFIGHSLVMEDPDGVRVQLYLLEKPPPPMDPSHISHDPR